MYSKSRGKIGQGLGGSTERSTKRCVVRRNITCVSASRNRRNPPRVSAPGFCRGGMSRDIRPPSSPSGASCMKSPSITTMGMPPKQYAASEYKAGFAPAWLLARAKHKRYEIAANIMGDIIEISSKIRHFTSHQRAHNSEVTPLDRLLSCMLDFPFKCKQLCTVSPPMARAAEFEDAIATSPPLPKK